MSVIKYMISIRPFCDFKLTGSGKVNICDQISDFYDQLSDFNLATFVHSFRHTKQKKKQELATVYV